jgi:hypothetical protein
VSRMAELGVVIKSHKRVIDPINAVAADKVRSSDYALSRILVQIAQSASPGVVR